MTRGSNDFSNVRNEGISFGVPTSSEALNRPRGVLSLDIRGQCILYNDFEDGTPNCVESNVNTPVYAGIDVNNVYPGDFSYRFSTNASNNSQCLITFGVPYSVASRIGFEAIWYCNVSNGIIRHKLHFYDGSQFHEAIIRFDTADSKTYLVDQTGTFIDITSMIPHDFPRAYYQNVKLVIDTITGYYVRLILNGVIYDLSSYQYKKSASTKKPTIEYQARFDNSTAASATAYIDNILITIREP